ncbi:SRPBCC family protein, partial [Cribrihabitans sp. XS_ASV171]
ADVYLGFLNPMLIYPDHAVLYRFFPVDALHSVQEVIWLVHEEAEEGRDYDQAALIWLWDVTTQADKRIIEDNQRGVASRFYRPGPLVEMEAWMALFIDSYIDTLLTGDMRT